MDQQQVLSHLQEAVRETKQFVRAHASDQLTRLPTGDGMAHGLSRRRGSSRALRSGTGPHRAALAGDQAAPGNSHRSGVSRRGHQCRNVAGGGINIAKCVMDCGDGGHILISKAVADVLDHTGDPVFDDTLRQN
jgi:hypothetical protein